MEGTHRRLHVGLGVMNAVVLCALIYVVARGLLLGKPWWLVLGPALVIPEITRMVLVELGGLQGNGAAKHGVTQLVTRTLSVLGILLLFVGVASM
jgi:hypothetical protein